MKILQINTVFPKGSTGKIVKDLDDYYRGRGYESIVLYGHGEKGRGDGHIKVCSDFYMKLQALRSRITGVMYGGCLLSTRRIIGIIRKEKPDIVHLHCLNGNFVNIYRLVSWLKNSGIDTVLTNHAEFIYTGSCGHALDCEKYLTGCGNCPRRKQETKSFFIDGTHASWEKMKKAFEGFGSLRVTNVSPWLLNRSEGSVILKDKKQCVVLNGLDTSVFSRLDVPEVKKDRKVVFQATANFSDSEKDLKGGIRLIELAQRLPKIDFIVAGKHPDALSVPENMKLLGRVNDQRELAKLYAQADLVVLTSKRETFSMVAAEALCCGTPVVGFEAGAPELIALPEYSRFVKQGDLDALESAVLEFWGKDFDRDAISLKAKNEYSKERMAREYEKVYETFKRKE